jgi:hypothetical protein
MYSVPPSHIRSWMWRLVALVAEPSTSQDILYTAGCAGLEPELEAGTEHAICNIEEQSGHAIPC